MPQLDLTTALGLRVANSEVLAVRIANTDVYTFVPPYSYFEGFEVDTGGWAAISVGHTISRVTTPTVGGSAGALFVNTTSNGTRTVGTTLTGLTVGKTYFADGWVRRTGTAVQNIALGVTGISLGTAVNPASNTWAYVSYSFTATSTSHQLYVQYSGTNTSSDLYLDSMTVVET